MCKSQGLTLVQQDSKTDSKHKQPQLLRLNLVNYQDRMISQLTVKESQ